MVVAPPPGWAVAVDAVAVRLGGGNWALAAFYADYDKLDHRTRASAYMRKMEQVAQRYPDDREAKIFYALSLLATADGLDKTYKSQLKAGGILEQIFAEKPEHPGPTHYIIHAYDYPALVDRALEAALKYAVCVTVVPLTAGAEIARGQLPSEPNSVLYRTRSPVPGRAVRKTRCRLN